MDKWLKIVIDKLRERGATNINLTPNHLAVVVENYQNGMSTEDQVYWLYRSGRVNEGEDVPVRT